MKRREGCTGCSRRAVLQGLGVTALGTLFLGAAGCQSGGPPPAASTACSGGVCIALSDPTNQPLTAAGGAMVVDTAHDTILVIRTSATEVIALSAMCTHEDCLVEFDASAQRVVCPCHGSQFGEDGRVLHGPARRPLRVYQATLAGEQITIAV